MKKLVFISMIITALAAGVVFSALAQDNTDGFLIKRLTVATGIENREPVGAGDSFPTDTPKAYCFLEAIDIEQDTNVIFVWIREGKEISQASLALKSGSRWRTRAEKTLHGMSGAWKVEIRNEAGRVLKDISFAVK